MEYIVFDVESTKKPRHKPWVLGAKLVTICIVRSDGTRAHYDFIHDSLHGVDFQKNINAIQAEIDSAERIVAHNAKFDMNWLRWIGINLDNAKVWCTQVGEYLLQGQRKVGYSLNNLCDRYGLERKLDKVAALWQQGYDTTEIDLDLVVEYCMKDCDLAEQIYNIQKEKIKEFGLSKVAELSFRTSHLLSDVETTGVLFDEPNARKYLAEFGDKVAEVDAELAKLAGFDFNPASPVQLAAVLFGGSFKTDGREYYTVTLKSGEVRERSRKCRVDKVVSGLGFPKVNDNSTDANVLSALHKNHCKTKTQREFMDLLLERRKIGKIASTFLSKDEKSGLISKVGVDGKIHPSFNQTVVATGRLSSSDPEPLGSLKFVNSGNILLGQS